MWLRRAAGYSAQEILLVGEAFIALGITRAALARVHFQTIRRFLTRLAGFGGGARNVDPGRIVWALGAVQRRLLGKNTCLIEALAAEALFRRHGHTPVLCIGASRKGDQFEAHAWLEMEQRVVVGGPVSVVEQYTRFPEIKS